MFTVRTEYNQKLAKNEHNQKSEGKVRTLDRKIMIALLKPQRSMYELADSLKEPYASVLRHVKKLEIDKLVKTEKGVKKDGKPDNRETKSLRLTEFGLATLAVSGEVSDKELRLVAERIFLKMSPKLQSLMNESGILGESILRIVFDRVRPKINLDCFDQEYFDKTFLISMAEYLDETVRHASANKIERMKKQTIPKVSNETISLMNEILETLEKERRRFTRLVSDLKTAIDNIEKSR
jgi:DNA-binding MarR family transcriptional regulator